MRLQTVTQVACLKDSQVVLFSSGLVAHDTSGSERANPHFFSPSQWVHPLTYFRTIACGHSHVLAIATHACGVSTAPCCRRAGGVVDFGAHRCVCMCGAVRGREACTRGVPTTRASWGWEHPVP